MNIGAGYRIYAPVAIALAGMLSACGGLSVLSHAEAGRGSTCVVSDKGALSCVGASPGDGSAAGPHTNWNLFKTLGAVKAVSLSIVDNNVCVISSANQVWCWNSDGPIKVPYALQIANLPLINVTNLSVGSVANPADPLDQDACAVVDASVICWQFEASPGFNGLNARKVVGLDGQFLSSIKQVSVGYGFACAVRSDNAVLCWGRNDAGQLGRGSVTGNPSLFPATPITGLAARTVSAGYNHACAVALDNSVQCWGADEYGQLGNGKSQITGNFPFASPQSVIGISNAVTVSAGWQFTCATLADISVSCWGQNEFGKLDRPVVIPTNPPLQQTHIATPSNVNLGKGTLRYVVVSAGRDHACASGMSGGFHPSTGTVTGLGLFVGCWGSNDFGQLTDTKLSMFVP